MDLFWLLYGLFAILCCLGNGASDSDLGLCSSTSESTTKTSDEGELPTPEMFLNATSAREGDWVFAQCTCPSNYLVTNIFFCKEGHLIAAHRADAHIVILRFNVSKQSAGQYSCGCQYKDSKNQEKKSTFSGAWVLIVLPGQTIPVYVWSICTTVVCFFLLSCISSFIYTCIMHVPISKWKAKPTEN